MFPSQHYAKQVRIDDSTLDGYAAKGVVLSRDAASIALAALRRDAFEMQTRGGDANTEGAALNEALADAILAALR